MSTTLNLVHHLLAQARHFQELGLNFEALRILQRLGKIDSLPAEVAEETQQRLGAIRLERHQYKKARRHFAAALNHRPGNAEYHFCLGRATQGENHDDAKRTLEHLARAVELAPENAEYLSDLGLQALRVGKSQAGLDALRKALALAPNDPSVLGKLAEGLRHEERVDEARALLRAAQFRHPRDGRFRKLWNDFQFKVVHAEQEERRRQELPVPEEEPTILAFARPGGSRPERKTVRRDAAERTSPPHERPRIRRHEQH